MIKNLRHVQVNIDPPQKLLPGSSLVISLPQKSPGVSCFEFWHLIHRTGSCIVNHGESQFFLLLCMNFLYSYKLGLLHQCGIWVQPKSNQQAQCDRVQRAQSNPWHMARKPPSQYWLSRRFSRTPGLQLRQGHERPDWSSQQTLSCWVWLPTPSLAVGAESKPLTFLCLSFPTETKQIVSVLMQGWRKEWHEIRKWLTACLARSQKC